VRSAPTNLVWFATTRPVQRLALARVTALP
jgi:hypothetical protein